MLARSLWRPFWAMVLAAPLGVLLRSLWLGTSTMIVDFTLVMGGLSALTLVGWRCLFWLFHHKAAALPRAELRTGMEIPIKNADG